MTKSKALELLGISQAQLSRLLDVSRAAVAQWPDDEPLPQLRQYQLERLRPDIFGAAPTRQRKRAA